MIQPRLSSTELIKIVLDSFEAEKTGDTVWGRQLITPDFKKTGMYIHNGEPFHRFELASDTTNALTRAYEVEGREFHVWRTAANEETQTVFIELAEVQPENDGTSSLWVYALVCDIVDGKIAHTRHYGDPRILKSGLSVDDVRRTVNE